MSKRAGNDGEGGGAKKARGDAAALLATLQDEAVAFDDRLEAANGLGDLGPHAGAEVAAGLMAVVKADDRRLTFPGTPALIILHNIRCAAVGALGKMGAEAVPHVAAAAELLAKEQSHDVREAITALVVSLGAAAVPPLAAALATGEGLMRRQAAFALGQLGAVAAAQAGALAAALREDGDAGVRMMSAVALGNIGVEAAGPHAGALAAALTQDADDMVRYRAVGALRDLGAAVAAQHAAALAELAADSSAPAGREGGAGIARGFAIRELAKLKDAARPHAAALAVVMTAPAEPDEVRQSAAAALGGLAPLPAGPTAALEAARGDPVVGSSAAHALAALKAAGMAGDGAALEGTLRSPTATPAEKSNAAKELGRLGAGAEPHADALCAVLVDDGMPAFGRIKAAEALGGLDGKAMAADAGRAAVLKRVKWALNKVWEMGGEVDEDLWVACESATDALHTM